MTLFNRAKERAKEDGDGTCMIRGVEDIDRYLDRKIREFVYPDDSVY